MPSTHEPRLGEVWDVDFDPRVGREQGGIRPALVISNEHFNRTPNALHIVVPITGTDRGIGFHIGIQPPEGGLSKTSVIMCDQARSQSIQRFMCKRGAVDLDTLGQVQRLVGRIIDC